MTRALAGLLVLGAFLALLAWVAWRVRRQQLRPTRHQATLRHIHQLEHACSIEISEIRGDCAWCDAKRDMDRMREGRQTLDSAIHYTNTSHPSAVLRTSRPQAISNVDLDGVIVLPGGWDYRPLPSTPPPDPGIPSRR